nr:sugar transferase [Bacillus sp. ISL-75]
MKTQSNSEIVDLNVNSSAPVYYVIKRIIDVIGAMTGILLTFPIQLVVMSFYIFGPNKGPVFFKQVRIGKYGQEFYIYKFRSMVVDAEKKLRENEELHQKYIKNNYKLEQDEDPRITSFGRFIRKTSLDELPQFINVLKGDMSLVGPRPVVLEELDEYKNRKEVFLSVKPGITGYWQVCGRSDVGYPDRVDIELYYAYNQSLWLDIKIMLKTILLVILRKGAY